MKPESVAHADGTWLGRIKAGLPDAQAWLPFIYILVVLVAYGQFGERPYRLFRLQESSYFQPSIALESLRYEAVVAIILLTALLLALNYARVERNSFLGRINWRLSATDDDTNLRFLVFAIALTIAWAFSTYSYNFYYDQPHLADRLLLVVLAFLTLLNPAFVGIFVAFAIIVTSQFTYPDVFIYAWFDKKLLYKILVLFSIFVVVRMLTRAKWSLFVYLALALIGSHYFIAGFSKFRVTDNPLDWVLRNRLHNLFVSSYVNGWLRFIDQQTILKAAQVLARLDVPLQVYTLIVEVGAIVLLVSKRASVAVLVGVMLLHLGIFAASGIFFWKWIILDALFLVFILRSGTQLDDIFQARYAWFSVAIIALSPLYFNPDRAGWFDSNVNNFYDFDGIDADGVVHSVPRSALAPYEIVFAQSNFFFLSDEKLLVGTYGTTRSLEFMDRLGAARDAQDLDALKEVYVGNRYNQDKAGQFATALQVFFHNHNRAEPKSDALRILGVPPHIWTFPTGYTHQLQVELQTIRVHRIETLYTGEEIQYLRDDIIAEIPISD